MVKDKEDYNNSGNCRHCSHRVSNHFPGYVNNVLVIQCNMCPNGVCPASAG